MRWTLSMLLAGAIASCKKGPPNPTEAQPPPTLNPTRSAAAATAPAVSPSTLTRPRRPILVGGCLEVCASAERGLKGFLSAALRGDVQSTTTFINTAALVHNGHAYGEAWAALFVEQRLGERRQQIDSWLKGWLSWSDQLIDPATRDRPMAGVTVVEENQRRLVVDYRHPELREPGALQPTWRIELRPRGLEWLVAHIEDGRRR